jgi:hypothetical protein
VDIILQLSPTVSHLKTDAKRSCSTKIHSRGT